jgi:hypothetical protein
MRISLTSSLSSRARKASSGGLVTRDWCPEHRFRHRPGHTNGGLPRPTETKTGGHHDAVSAVTEKPLGYGCGASSDAAIHLNQQHEPENRRLHGRGYGECYGYGKNAYVAEQQRDDRRAPGELGAVGE